MSEVKRYWIYKGTSNFCEELIPDDNCENMVKQKPDGFYDIVSTNDTIEGGVEVVLASDYEKLKAQLERAEESLKFYANEMNYSIDDYRGISGEMITRCILYSDCEERNDVYSYAGRRAREYFKEKRQV